jgi:hypothetical protein
VDDRAVAQLFEQAHRPGQRPPLVGRQQLAEQLVVALLNAARLLFGQLVPQFSADGAREQPAAHADPAVDPPAVDRHVALLQRLLPREHVRVHGVHQRAVEVEDERRHLVRPRAAQ